MAKDWRVTVVFDYSTDEDVDADELHDALRDNFDDVDLEFDFEAATFDAKGMEIVGKTQTVNVNCDTVRQIDVEPAPE